MILALEYCERDLFRTMQLARLLADLEPVYRADMLLGLVCQPGTSRPKVVDETLEYCSSKFPIEHVVSRYGAPGWADGSGQLWRGTVTHFRERLRRGEISHTSIATFDGGDGVPLHNNWHALLVAEHEKTCRAGKLVSGLLNLDVPRYAHINGNMILELALLDLHPTVLDIPLGASPAEYYKCWDIFHADIFLGVARPSTVVRNCWNSRGITKEIMRGAAVSSVWLHGYKDDCLYDVARELLLGDLNGHPTTPEVRSKDDLWRTLLENT